MFVCAIDVPDIKIDSIIERYRDDPWETEVSVSVLLVE